MITYTESDLKDKNMLGEYLILWLKFADEIDSNPNFPMPKSTKSDFYVMVKRRIKKFKYARLFFVKDDDKYIGYILASVIKSDSSGWINDVYLDKEYRSKGIADKNIKLSIKWLWKVGGDAIYLNSMPNIESFYKRNGFSTVSMAMVHNKSKNIWGGDY